MKTIKSKYNYRIFRVERSLEKGIVFIKKITMKQFTAPSNIEAYKQLQDYKTIANKKYDYYFESYQPFIVIDNKGKKHEFEFEFQAEWFVKELKKKWYKKIFEHIEDFFTITIWSNVVDAYKAVKHWFRDMIYFNKYRQDYQASWNFDNYMLKSIIHNVSILKKERCGIPFKFYDMARMYLHKDENDFDLKKYNEEHWNFTDEETKLAEKFLNEEYDKIILYIKLYWYYLDQGDTNEYPEIDANYRHTLPIIKGTYDSFDKEGYAKLEALRMKYWNKIWEWMRQYGETLWD